MGETVTPRRVTTGRLPTPLSDVQIDFEALRDALAAGATPKRLHELGLHLPPDYRHDLELFGWEWASDFFDEVEESTEPDRGIPFTPPMALEQGDVDQLFARRSLSMASPGAIPWEAMRTLLATLFTNLAHHQRFAMGVVVQGVEKWPPGSYLLVDEPRGVDARRSGDLSELVRRSIQGQGFAARGGGLCLYFGVRVGPTSPAEYASFLRAAGRILQASLMAVLPWRLAGRMTPTVHESTCQEIFDTQCIEFLHMIKIGYPLDVSRRLSQ